MWSVFFFAIFLVSLRQPLDPRHLALILLAILLSPFLLAPIKIHASSWTNANPRFVPTDPEGPDVPPEASDFYRECVADLAPLGFVTVRTYMAPDLVPNAVGILSLLENRESGEGAKILTTVAETRGRRKTGLLLAFFTEFTDGTEVGTSNTLVPRIYPPLGPPIHWFVFPQLREADRLHAAHQALVGRVESGRLRRAPIGGDPDGYLNRTERRFLAHQLACGYYYLEEAAQLQRPTWKGAILISWKLLWPVKPIRREWRRWKAGRMIRALGLA